MTKQDLKRTLFYLGLSGLGKLSHKNIRNKKAYCCLLYHRVIKDNHDNKAFNISTKVNESSFLEQMAEVAGHCVPIPLSEMVERHARGIEPDEFYVSLTFDDGYEDNFTVAYPILKHFKIPATIFLATGFIDDENRLPWWDKLELLVNNSNSKVNMEWNDKRYHFDLCSLNGKMTSLHRMACLIRNDIAQADLITDNIYCSTAFGSAGRRNDFLRWDQIREMGKSGLIDFAPHTVNHLTLASTSAPGFFEEVMKSKSRIIQETGTVENLFAYPFGGDYSGARKLKEYFIENNFSACFSGGFGYIDKKSDPYFLNRVPISGRDSKGAFTNKLIISDVMNRFSKLPKLH